MTFLFIILCLGCVALGFWIVDLRQRLKTATHELEQINQNIAAIETEARRQASGIIKQAEQMNTQAREFLASLDQQRTLRLAEIEAAVTARREFLEGLEKSNAEKLKESERLDSLLAALRRRIDGVGDEYVLPIHDLLDGLAEDFGYQMAGMKLKAAREHSKEMVKDKRAVSCDWGNDAYKNDAIRLMLETFNAQVDVALEGLKREENAGKVMQEIKDIFEALNDYGTRCMRASVNKEYLKARLAEAKWGAITAELKHQEREEQRELAAKMREEAKVQREIERAKREAEEEEARARRAMEKAEADARKKELQLKEEHDRQVRELEKAMREAEKATAAERERLQAEIALKLAEVEAQAAEASAAEKARHEAQTLELQRRLAEAEAEGERALSMAQQTKRGHVYVISNRGSFGDGMLKIGMTRRLDPQERVDELGDASVPFDFDIHAMVQSDNAPDLEYELHKAFAEKRVNKVNHRKEFFRLGVKEVKELLEAKGVHASWTIAAQSKEYLETLAWEERMAKDPSQKRKWAEQFGAKRINFDDVEPSPPK